MTTVELKTFILERKAIKYSNLLDYFKNHLLSKKPILKTEILEDVDKYYNELKDYINIENLIKEIVCSEKQIKEYEDKYQHISKFYNAFLNMTAFLPSYYNDKNLNILNIIISIIQKNNLLNFDFIYFDLNSVQYTKILECYKSL